MKLATIDKNTASEMVLSISITASVFILVLSFFYPLLNSGDDFFLMYQLSGGFGDEPTNLLYYDHTIQPWLGYILSNLFRSIPSVNWYCLTLLCFQWLGWSLAFYTLLRKFKKSTAIGIFIVLFVLVGIRGLISLNVTFTSWLLAISALFYLLQHARTTEMGRPVLSLILTFLLLYLAGSIRMHIPLLACLLFIPLYFVAARKSFIKYLVIVFILFFALFSQNLFQKEYNRRNIPAWSDKEEFRQNLFYSFNHPKYLEKSPPHIFRDSLEQSLYERFFFYDSSAISKERIKQISHGLSRYRNFSHKDDFAALYWIWISWRLYLLFIFVVLIIAWTQGVLLRILKTAWLPILVMFGFYLYLFLFLKITEPFQLAVLLYLSLVFAILWPDPSKKPKRVIFDWVWLLILFPLAWSLKRDIDKNSENIINHKKFLCFQKELNSQNEKLFLATDDTLPLAFFYYADSPSEFKVTNLIYKDRLITFSINGTLNRYSIKDINRALFEDPRVYLLGSEFSQLETYVLNKYGVPAELSLPDSSFKCLQVRKLRRQL